LEHELIPYRHSCYSSCCWGYFTLLFVCLAPARYPFSGFFVL